jgi:hypothetical protein
LKESKGEMNYNEVRKIVGVNDLGKKIDSHIAKEACIEYLQ